MSNKSDEDGPMSAVLYNRKGWYKKIKFRKVVCTAHPVARPAQRKEINERCLYYSTALN